MRTGLSRKIWIAPLLLAVLGGCVYSREVEKTTPSPVVMTPAPPAPAVPTVPAVATDRVVYPEGRWQLFGDGKRAPYYWVWIPNGSTVTSAPPPPSSPTVSSTVVVPPTDRTYTYPEGRWQLYGDGRSTPYYWVWIPSGASPPVPPIPPQAG